MSAGLSVDAATISAVDDDARTRRSGFGGRPYPTGLRERAAQLRLEGVGSRLIAEQLGVSRATVCRWFRDDGVLPADLERHGRARAWAAQMAERWALDPRRSCPGHRRHDPSTVRLNTGEDYRGCFVITVTKSASLYRRLQGTWNGVVESAGARSS